MFAIKAVIKKKTGSCIKKTPHASEQGAIFIFVFTNGVSAFWMTLDIQVGLEKNITILLQ